MLCTGHDDTKFKKKNENLAELYNGRKELAFYGITPSQITSILLDQ